MVQIDEVPSFRGIWFDPEIGIFADEERLREAARNADSLADIINNLGLRASGARYAQLRAALVKFGIRQPTKHRLRRGNSTFGDRETVARAVRGAATQKQALEQLGVSLAGKNYERLEAVCAAYRIPVPPKRPTGPLRVRERRAREERKEKDRAPRWAVLADAEAVQRAVSTAPSWSVAAQRLWGTTDLKDREMLRARCEELGLAPAGRQIMGILADRDAVAAAVSGASSVVEVLTRLNLGASQHQRLHAACAEYGIKVPRADMAAMARISHEKAKAAYRWGHPDDVLKRDPSIPHQRVRRMVLRYDLVPYVCALCETLPIWRGNTLTLILDHQNGDHSDHRLENLRFVCPNCESQLPTHGSRNRRRKAA